MAIDIAGDDPYTVATGILELLFHVYDNPDRGTGIYVLVARSRNLVGMKLPPALIHNALGKQFNLLGKYPVATDIAPLILFACLFGVIAVLHLIIYGINTSRGHHFVLNLIWFVNTLMRMVSFVLRATWAKDVSWVKEGIANEILLVLPSIVLVSTNLILAQRLFTWRHPVGGSRRLFWIVMLVLYVLVALFTTVSIVASAIPYLSFLSTERFLICINLNRWICTMIPLYTLTASILIGLSLWFPTKKDESRYTYQPWWVESFAPFYFVKKGAAQKAEETFMKRNSNHRHATRVIAATHHHYKMVRGLSNQRGDLKHNVSLVIIIMSTLGLFTGSILRCVVVYEGRTNFKSGPASVPVAMYFSWGVIEVFINAFLILGRADLRFYRPDALPARVKAIITAEQTNVLPSANVSEDEEEDDDDDDEDDGDEDDDNEYDYKNHDLRIDIETPSLDYFSDLNDNDEIYFTNEKNSAQLDSGLTSVPPEWKSEKGSSMNSYDFNNHKTVVHTPNNEKENPHKISDEFQF